MFLTAVASLHLALAGPVRAAVVDGLAAFRGDPQAGVRVWALDSPVFDPGAGSGRISAPTDAGGRFALDLEKGTYYLMALKKGPGAKRSIEPGDLYCFYSGNPVRVGSETIHVGFNLGRVPDDGSTIAGFTGVEGSLLFEDKPLGRAYLYVYKDASDEFKGMGLYVAPVGPDGRFKVHLQPGRYFLIARQRQEGGMYGPLKKNDKVGYYYANPVTVTENRSRKVVLELINRMENIEDPQAGKGAAGAFILEGSVKDTSGKPLEGLYVLLYDNPETSGKPRYVSTRTNGDGTFRLDVRNDGKYYPVARESLGGPPGEGEYYGRHEDKGKQPIAVTLDRKTPQARLILTIGRYKAPTSP